MENIFYFPKDGETRELGESIYISLVYWNENVGSLEKTIVVCSYEFLPFDGLSSIFTDFLLLTTLKPYALCAKLVGDTLSLGCLSSFYFGLRVCNVVSLEVCSLVSCRVFSSHSSMFTNCSISRFDVCT